MSYEFYTAEDVCTMLHIRSESTLHRMIKSGRLPKPFRPSGRTRLWEKEKLDAFIKNRIEEAK